MATRPGWWSRPLAARPATRRGSTTSRAIRNDVEVEIGHQRYRVTARTLDAQERASAWERITREMPQFKGYETKTDREMPVVRLSAV